MTAKAKKFDGVEMSRRLRQVASRKLQAMNRDEELAYLRRMAERHRAEVKAPTKSAKVSS